MPARYEVRLRDTTGAIKAIFDSWSDKGGLSYSKILDGIGDYSLSIPFDDARRAYFVKDAFVEIRRQDMDHNIDWYTDFVGLHRDVEKDITDDHGKRVFVSRGPDLNHMLKRGHILYFSDDPLATQDTFADDAMKNFVDQAIGPSAVAPPRIRDHVFPSFNVEALVGAGPIWSGARSFNELLSVLHEIALASLVDFQVTLDAWSPLSMTFRTYYPYLGNDRSQGNTAGNTPAIFSLAQGNMARPHYTSTSRDEVTAVIVLGQGNQSTRDYEVVEADGTAPTESHIHDSPWNDIERTIDQRQDGLITSLTQAGYAELQHAGVKTDVTFDILTSSRLVYGRDYGFGDLVTVTFDDNDGPFNKRVTGIHVSVVGPNDTVQPTFSEIT